jgi:PadR family transcriptional regulator AphA
MASEHQLDLIEGACLVLISNGISHGYQLAKQFESGAALGEVLTLTRPVIYRAIKSLETQKLIRSADSLGSRGQLKFKLKCTSDGEKLAKQWLSEPVSHIRDLRDEFLIKILLLQTFNLNTKRLIHTQRQTLKNITKTLLADLASNPVAIWRREQARTAMRFLDELDGASQLPSLESKKQFQVSARNQLRAEVAKVRHGDTLSTVYLSLEPNQTMTSTITRDAADDLSLAPGSQVVALFKATEVMIAQSIAEVG